MKILWIAHFLPWPPHGGSSQRNYNLMRELLKKFDLYTVGFLQRPHYESDQQCLQAIRHMSSMFTWMQVYHIPTDHKRISWYWLLATNILSSSPYSVKRFYSDQFESELDRLLDRVNFDIVYADTVATAHYALRAKGKSKLVLNHHNVESSLLFRRAASAKNPASRWYLNHQAKKMHRWETKVCPQFDINLTVSELDADELRRLASGIRCEVIANGSDIEYFKPSDGVVGSEMVFAGGGTWLPNRDAMSWFIKEIFPKIIDKVPDAVMNVIGGKPPHDVLKAAEHDKRIKVHGFVPDTRPFLARSAVYVVPIRIGGGTRLKILDAFAAGKAVVSTSLGCEGISCEDGVHICMADTPEAFADKVVELFNNIDDRQKLERNARQLVERAYSWKIIGSRLRSLYRELLS